MTELHTLPPIPFCFDITNVLNVIDVRVRGLREQREYLTNLVETLGDPFLLCYLTGIGTEIVGHKNRVTGTIHRHIEGLEAFYEFRDIKVERVKQVWE